MKEISCCFTVHRIIANEKIIALKRHIEIETVKLINQGVIYFGVGGARGFDSIVALTILRLKLNFQQIKLISVLPCK